MGWLAQDIIAELVLGKRAIFFWLFLPFLA
jgi:hypothetical protein